MDAVFGYDFFISYAHADGKIYADDMAERLMRRGFECFLDTEDYAKGDDWQVVGAWALKKTSRLVLVGTPKALQSKPVLRELKIFTSSGKRIIPIDFDGSLDSENNADSPVINLIGAATLRIGERSERLNKGPSDDVLKEIVDTFKHTRQSVKRRHWLQGFVILLGVLLGVAVWQAITANVEREKAVQAGREASRQLAEANWLVAQEARGSPYAVINESPIKAVHYLLRAASAAEAANEIFLAWNASYAAKIAGASIVHTLVHDGSVDGVINSPDGQHILTWSEDGTARLWNASDGHAVGEPMKHEQKVWGARYSPDGKRILTWTGDTKVKGDVRLWSASDGKAIGVPMKHQGVVDGAIYSPDGKRILTWSWDGTARLWSAENGTAVGEPMKHENMVIGASYSPDGQRVLTRSSDNTARLWNASDGHVVAEPMKHKENSKVRFFSTSYAVDGAVYSPDGQRILTWSGDGTARLWNARDGQAVGEPMEQIKGAAYTPDAQRILTWGGDGTLRFWNVSDGKAAGKLMAHEESVSGVVYSPDGQSILSWSQDGTARLWNAINGKAVGEPMKHGKPVQGGIYSPDGQRILTWSEDGIARSWNANDATSVGDPMVNEHKIRGAQYSIDGKRILAWSANYSGGSAEARLWDANDGKAIGGPMKHERSVRGAIFAQDGYRVITWSQDGAARLWNTTDKQDMGEPIKHGKEIERAIYTPDGKRILTVGGGEARLWSASDGKPIGEAMKHTSMHELESDIGPLFSADGQRVLTWSEIIDGTGEARLWNVGDGKPVGKAMTHVKGIGGVIYSNNGQQILTWSGGDIDSSGEAMLWDARNGSAVSSPMKHGKRLVGARFSTDQQRILTWSFDGTARLWNAGDGKAATDPMKHTPEQFVIGGLFSPDGKRVLTWSGKLGDIFGDIGNGEARLWNVVDGKPIGAVMKHDQIVTGAVYSPDGQHILTWSGNRDAGGEARLWNASDGKPVSEPMKFDSGFRGDHHGVPMYSHNGQLILTLTGLRSGERGEARLWNSSNGKAIGEPMNHVESITGAMFSPDGQRVLTWSEDETARLWSTVDGKQVGQPMKHDNEVRGALYSADGQNILTWSFDGTARLWNARDGKAIGIPMHGSGVFGALFSTDGQRIMTWGEDMVQLWSVVNSQCIAIFKPMGSNFTVSFNQGDKQILTASKDGTVQQWDIALEDGLKTEHRILEFEVRSATTIGLDGQVRVLHVAEWEKKAELLDMVVPSGMSEVSSESRSSSFTIQ